MSSGIGFRYSGRDCADMMDNYRPTNRTGWLMFIKNDGEANIMPRATTKAGLIASANGKWDILWKLIDSIGIVEKKLFSWTGVLASIFT